MNRTITKKEVDDLERTLLANPQDNWASILSDYFNVDYQIIEMIITGYNELGGDTMMFIMNKINNGGSTTTEASESDIFYNNYLNGQIIEPNEDDKRQAELAIQKAEEHVRKMREQQKEQEIMA
jgi:hypothetical protein